MESVWIRVGRPSPKNKYYNRKYGPNKGYSSCIRGEFELKWSSRYLLKFGYNLLGKCVSDLDVLPNCVGLANGAFNETYVQNKRRKDKSFPGKEYYTFSCNAKRCIEVAKGHGLETRGPDKRPPLGGLIVWEHKSDPNVAGHVAYITDVSKDGNTIKILQSGWGGGNGSFNIDLINDPTWPSEVTIKRNNNWAYYVGESYHRCIGFVVNPAIPDDATVDKVQKRCVPYIVVNGKWKRAQAYIKHNKKWKKCIEKVKI